MKKRSGWAHAPYRPLFFDAGEIYICRVAPETDSLALEWLPDGSPEYTVFLRPRGTGDFAPAAVTGQSFAGVTGLAEGTEYEFYVAGSSGRSRTRLCRCGPHVGTAVNYLHPEDEAYVFSGRYLCSPSLVRLPDGALLASMDVYGKNMPQNLTLIFRSDDEGRSWHYVSELFPCFWGRMFLHRGALYMLACSTEYGDLLIGRSDDGGVTFTEPAVLFRGGGGKNGEAGIHKNPQPVIEFGGRIWNTCEWGSWQRDYRHAAMVFSAPADADLTDPGSWSFSAPVIHDDLWNGPLTRGKSAGVLEGCLVPSPDGKELYNILRYQMQNMEPNFGYAAAYRVDTADPEAPLAFERLIPFPANHSKFVIRYDAERKKYYSLGSRITDPAHPSARNLLSLLSSPDLLRWEAEADVYDFRDSDPALVGFQYVDLLLEGDRILFLCRTAMNGAHSFHDSNYSTFDVIDIQEKK